MQRFVKKKIREKMSLRLEIILADIEFYDLMNDFTYRNACRFVEFYNRHSPYFKDVCFTYGSYKFVIIFTDEDWVIKFNFVGDVDGCERELICFNEAVSEGCHQFFCQCDVLPQIFGNTPYIMKKALIDPYRCDDYLSSSLEEEGFSDEEISIYATNDEYETNLVTSVFSTYFSHDEVLRLLTFINIMGINDIHDENIGYIDERPFIIDYAGV